MDRVLRIVGVVAVVATSAWAWSVFDSRVTSDGPTPAVAAPAEVVGDLRDPGVVLFDGGDEIDLTIRDADGEPPRLLALRPGLVSRPYEVAASPSDERDRSSSRASSRSDYPIETDLVPTASLAATVPIQPGLYSTGFDVEGCAYELRRTSKGGDSRVIGQDWSTEGRMLVSLNDVEPDDFIPQPQCGPWIPWTPLAEPLVVAGPGDYWLGDLAKGGWAVPPGCLWEQVVGFRGARLADVVASGQGPGTLVIDDETVGIRLRHCDQPIVLTVPVPPHRPHRHQ